MDYIACSNVFNDPNIRQQLLNLDKGLLSLLDYIACSNVFNDPNLSREIDDVPMHENSATSWVCCVQPSDRASPSPSRHRDSNSTNKASNKTSDHTSHSHLIVHRESLVEVNQAIKA